MFEVALDALRRGGTKAVEFLQQVGVEGSGLSRQQSIGERNVPALVEESVYREELGEEVRG